MTRLSDDEGSILPLTATVLASLMLLVTGFVAATAIAGMRVKANHAADSVALVAAGRAFAGLDPCLGLSTQRPFEISACEAKAAEVSVTVVTQVPWLGGRRLYGSGRVGHLGVDLWGADP